MAIIPKCITMKKHLKDSKIKRDSGHIRVQECLRVLGVLLKEVSFSYNQPLATAYRTAEAYKQQCEKGVYYDRA